MRADCYPHTARYVDFKVLEDRLEKAVADGWIRRCEHDGLRLYCYTEAAVYERHWTLETMMARGLIVDDSGVVATPFPKFFNVEERGEWPDIPFETYEKVDGSLIIVFWWKGEWRTATKGSLTSDQAKWAKAWLDSKDTSCLVHGITYLAEAVYDENRIVIRYPYEGLVFLGAYGPDGREMGYETLSRVAKAIGARVAERHEYSSVSELLNEAKSLPATHEGWVLRFENGLRLKVKGDEYRRIHRLISGVTPLGIWNTMRAGDDLQALRRQLPEEFWIDFDSIVEILQSRIDTIVTEVHLICRDYEDRTDKEVGLELSSIPEPYRKFIFPYRKNGDLLAEEKSRRSLFQEIRPTGNKLEGYKPSSAMSRVADEG